MKIYVRLFLFLLFIFFSMRGVGQTDAISVSSPDQRLQLKVALSDSIRYTLAYQGKTLLKPSAVALILKDRCLGCEVMVRKTSRRSVRQNIKPLYGQSAKIQDRYNEVTLDFSGDFSLQFRAYNEGVAYRFITGIKDSIVVQDEKASFNFIGEPKAIYAETDVLTAWELSYVKYPSIRKIPEAKMAITPALFSDLPGGVKIVIAEADLLDYPGMYLKKQNGKLEGVWAKYPSRTEMGSWGNFVSVVKERSECLARTKGTRSFPWRAIIVAAEDKSLLNNHLVYQLSRPLAISQTSWIKPGKAAWEWWHDALLPGAQLPSGMENRNTALYKYYIDFAAENHLEYLMLDAGWSDNYDLKKIKPRVDVRELIRYGKEKKVGVFLWCVGSTLLDDLEGNLDFIQSLGASGIKVDFFDRDDQLAMQWFERIAKAAAKRRLMVNFHGCPKPTGLQRAYPNILNYEAVRGAECSKWDFTANPDQHLLYPFVRMIAGPMDYTPGSMRNKSRETFKPVDPGLPSTQGTRCHELAMFVVFDQPLAMLCDSPTEYEKYPDIMSFLSTVPTVFDETRALDGKLGEYALIAKRKGDNWYVGAMNSWNAVTLDLNFSFLEKGKTYLAELYLDGPDADTQAETYTRQTIRVTRDTRLQLPLAKGGGAVAYLHDD